jgi:hypothetical protein
VNSNQNYSTIEPAHILRPYEAELRTRLHDILEDWEDYADKIAHPALQKEIRAMIDQISDAMYPAEDG